MSNEEKHLDHAQPKNGDQVQIGKPITTAEENAKHEREQALTMAKAFRFTKDSSNAFIIDMGEGKSVQDTRPIKNTGMNGSSVVAKSQDYEYSRPGMDTLPGRIPAEVHLPFTSSRHSISEKNAAMKDGITVSVEQGQTVVKYHGKPVDVVNHAQERHIGGKIVYELPGGVQIVHDGNITTITDTENGTEIIADQNGILARVQSDKQNHRAVVDLPGGQTVRLPGGEIVSADGQVTGQCAVNKQYAMGTIETDRIVELPNGMKVSIVPDFSDSYDGLSSGTLSSIASLSTIEGQSIPVDQSFDPRDRNHPTVFQTFAAVDHEGPKIGPGANQLRPEFLSNLKAIEPTAVRFSASIRNADLTHEAEVSKKHVPTERGETAVAFAEHERGNPVWNSDHVHHTYKCNSFVDACMRAGHANLPWDREHVPTVQDILRNPPHDWHRVDRNEPMKPGDIVMWSGKDYNHCSIYDGKGSVIYAGSAVEPGWAKSQLDLIEKSPMGKPQAIFRPPYSDK